MAQLVDETFTIPGNVENEQSQLSVANQDKVRGGTGLQNFILGTHFRTGNYFLIYFAM